MTTVTEYTQQLIEKDLQNYKPGWFRAFPVVWELFKVDSGAHGLKIGWAIFQMWVPDTIYPPGRWSQEYPIGWYSNQTTWIIKKDGTINEGAAAALMKDGIWNGDMDAFLQPPPLKYFLVDIGEEPDGKGVMRTGVKWTAPDASIPPPPRGAYKPTDTTLLSAAKSTFQSQFNALRGGGAGGRPPAPPAMPPMPGAHAPHQQMTMAPQMVQPMVHQPQPQYAPQMPTQMQRPQGLQPQPMQPQYAPQQPAQAPMMTHVPQPQPQQQYAPQPQAYQSPQPPAVTRPDGVPSTQSQAPMGSADNPLDDEVPFM